MELALGQPATKRDDSLFTYQSQKFVKKELTG